MGLEIFAWCKDARYLATVNLTFIPAVSSCHFCLVVVRNPERGPLTLFLVAFLYSTLTACLDVLLMEIALTSYQHFRLFLPSHDPKPFVLLMINLAFNSVDLKRINCLKVEKAD